MSEVHYQKSEHMNDSFFLPESIVHVICRFIVDS